MMMEDQTPGADFAAEETQETLAHHAAEANNLIQKVYVQAKMICCSEARAALSLAIKEVRDVPRVIEEWELKCARLKAEYEEDLKKHLTGLTNLCQAAFSDVFIGWIHIKAMRIFVNGENAHAVVIPEYNCSLVR